MKKTIGLIFAVVLAGGFLAPSLHAQAAGSSSAGDSSQQPLSERALYAVGTIGSTQLYYTYLVLGLLGDSYAKGVYDKSTALSLVDEIKNLTAASKEALTRLNGSGEITQQDSALLAEMSDALDALSTQADGLSAYVNEKDNGASFQSSRQVAWKKISAILGIEGVDASK